MEKFFIFLLAVFVPAVSAAGTYNALVIPIDKDTKNGLWYAETGIGIVSTNSIKTRKEEQILSIPGTTGAIDKKNKSGAERIIVGRKLSKSWSAEAAYVGGIVFRVNSYATNEFLGTSLQSTKKMEADSLVFLLRKDWQVSGKTSIFGKIGWARYRVKLHQRISDGISVLESRETEYGGFPTIGLGLTREIKNGWFINGGAYRDGAEALFFGTGKRF